MATEAVPEFAPAKVNLCLHVTGQRADGYHLLDSLVVFAGVGDRVTVTPGTGFTLQGPAAPALTGALDDPADNLCLRAAAAMGGGVHVLLDKHLPVAAGLGGGSADAAAVLRAMSRTGRRPPDPARVLALGADVPVCLAGAPMRMRGVGEVLTPVTLPPAWLVLVNPGVPVPTADVFRGLARRDNPPMGDLPFLPDALALAHWLAGQRNDLEPPARAIAPAVGAVLAALADLPACLLARMSGSGATCFGLFADGNAAAHAALALQQAHREWWVVAAAVLEAADEGDPGMRPGSPADPAGPGPG